MISSIKPRAFKVSALLTAMVALAGGISWSLLHWEKPKPCVSPQSSTEKAVDSPKVADASELLGMVTDGHRSTTARVNALLSLLQSGDEDAVKEALASIGELPFNETRTFWESFLRDRSQPAEYRATGAEALAQDAHATEYFRRSISLKCRRIASSVCLLIFYCTKSQTLRASPAEPGDLHWTLGRSFSLTTGNGTVGSGNLTIQILRRADKSSLAIANGLPQPMLPVLGTGSLGTQIEDVKATFPVVVKN